MVGRVVIKFIGFQSHFLKAIYTVIISDISSKFHKVKLIEFGVIISTQYCNVHGKVNVISEK